MRRFAASLLLAVLCLGAVYAQGERQTYFSTEELPDLIQCLPAPPEKGSPGFKYDVQRYKWGKAQRNNPERADMARRDAIWSYEALLTELSVPFGIEISAERTPELWKLVTTSLATTDQMRVAPKAYYHRTRPFVYFKEKAFLEHDAQFSGEGSYPSGHTMRSWTAALILSEVNPSAAEAIFSRAWECGISRVISGAHWQSDVDVTRLAASIGYARLQTSPEFRAQMALAQDEYRRLASPDHGGREHFVKISDVIPDVILEIRYYSTHNFVGRRIDGYLSPTALLTRQAADSLKVVSDELKARGYRLKIYDAYRPQCAVDHFVRWAADVPDTLMKRCFYPDVDKNRLFELEFIMEKSGHTRGSTVDLTLFDMATGKDVDMGGPFDWFGQESHPDYTGISAEQYANRMILRDAMLRRGFKPLDSEWWHFTLRNEPFPDTYFTFPVW